MRLVGRGFHTFIKNVLFPLSNRCEISRARTSTSHRCRNWMRFRRFNLYQTLWFIKLLDRVYSHYFLWIKDLVEHLRSNIGVDERQENRRTRDWWGSHRQWGSLWDWLFSFLIPIDTYKVGKRFSLSHGLEFDCSFCNNPSPPLEDIVLFGLSLPDFPSRFLKRIY